MSSGAKQYRLFLDMDGVFCDFEKQIQIMESNQKPETKVREGTTLFWDTIFELDPDFFANMDWMPGAEVLWSKVLDYLKDIGQKNPIFLTGCPKTKGNQLYEEAVEGKKKWVETHIAPEVIYEIVIQPTESSDSAAKWRMILEGVLKKAKSGEIVMIFCRPEQKYFFNQPLTNTNSRKPLLLDDRMATKSEWEIGDTGIFVHHGTKANQTEQEKKNAVINSVFKLMNYGLTKPFTGGKSSRKQTHKQKRKQKATKKRTPSRTSRRV